MSSSKSLIQCWSSPMSYGTIPCPQAAHSCDVVGGTNIYVFGGWNGKHTLCDVHVLNTRTMVWRKVFCSFSPEKRNNHSTAVVGTKIYVHGGHDGSTWLEDLFVFDTETERWREIYFFGQIPSPRACHTLNHVNGRLYMFGGYDGSECFNNIEILDLDAMAWIKPEIKGYLPQSRNAHTMTTVNSSLILFGGHSGNKHLTDLHIFDTTTLTWSELKISGTPPPGLRGHSANLVGERIVIFGGYDGKKRSNEIYMLEVGKVMKWINMPEAESPPPGRQRHAACLVGTSQLLIFGGFDGTKWLNDIHVLDLSHLTEDILIDETTRDLVVNLKKLVGNNRFSDVTFIVQGQEIPAHKNILAAQCVYFDKMFQHPVKESIEGKIQVFDQWSYKAFLSVLEFIYTGRLCDTDWLTVCEVMGIADMYLMDSLKNLCQASLRHSIEISNVCEIYRWSDKYQAPDLLAACEAYISKHAVEVTKTKAFENLAQSPRLILNIAKISLVKPIQEVPCDLTKMLSSEEQENN